jgi:signal peptidase I
MLLAVADAVLPDRGSALARAGVLLAVQLVAAFVLLRRLFRLASGRALAPLAALFAVNAAQLAMVFFVVRPHLFESFKTPGQSMSPTIEPGDRFVVGKLRPAVRWDLVVYWGGDAAEPQKYVKRLVGLPGERLRFEGGGVIVSDYRVETPPMLRGKLRASPAHAAARGLARYGDEQEIELGPNEYFFIGDNGEVSADSRLQGPTDRSALIGVVDFVYWPPSRARVVRW